jgi:hypothetical protein
VIIDFNSSLRGFATKDEPNLWICIDFKNHLITPTHYSIRTRINYDSSHPPSWIVEELSIEGEWIALDSQTEPRSLTGRNIVGTFSIGNVCEVRSVRLRQTGLDSSIFEYLVLKSIEFSSELRPFPLSVQ